MSTEKERKQREYVTRMSYKDKKKFWAREEYRKHLKKTGIMDRSLLRIS